MFGQFTWHFSSDYSYATGSQSWRGCWYHGFYDLHGFSADGAGYFWPGFLFQVGEWIDTQDQLKETDQGFAAWVQKAIASYPSEAFWQYVEHEEIEKVFTCDGSGSVFVGFGMQISVGDRSILALKDVLFADNPFVEISAKIDQPKLCTSQ